MDILHTLESDTFSPAQKREALAALENGKVIYFPKLTFELTEDEKSLLTPTLSDGKAKNISMDPNGRIQHSAAQGAQRELLTGMMQRFAEGAFALIGELFPGYTRVLERARTSYRPAEIEGRVYSKINDDTRLHVDAFPTRPMRGRRILRLFSNVNPNGQPRVWHVGEPFEDMAMKVLPFVNEPVAAKSLLLALVGVTRGMRAPYDSIMLGLHDEAKLDEKYQKNSPHTEIAFPPGSTWLCFTDQVMHAALAGQYVLEQTFHLDIDAMGTPDRAPIKVLERMMKRKLA